MECVKDVLMSGTNDPSNIQGSTQIQNLKNGSGIGRKYIHEREPSISDRNIKAALRTFQSTGVYLELLKKGGLPEYVT